MLTMLECFFDMQLVPKSNTAGVIVSIDAQSHLLSNYTRSR